MQVLAPARQKFLQIAALPDDLWQGFHLWEGALAIAWEEYPTIDLAIARQQMDEMAAVLRSRLAEVSYPLRQVREVGNYLFEELGFRGNEADYYHPRNSFITDVLRDRLGIPISLSLLYLVLGERIGLPFAGIGLPGHFIVRPCHPDLEIFVDPFYGGEILFPEDCGDRLREIYRERVTLRPEYLQPVSGRQILERMLGNLKGIYLQRQEARKALAATERLLALNQNAPQHWRDCGLLHYQLADGMQAKRYLQEYLGLAPEAPDREIVTALVRELEGL
ncbi:MAG: tetratricopeptide repeat protein [Oscillatoriales cyanobacterium SM2_1_8]|nr:tetratricopeptide repeat protein [Oscillatoriales cyanobacterium SM2_1_8]